MSSATLPNTVLVQASRAPKPDAVWELSGLDRANHFLVLRGTWIFEGGLEPEQLKRGLGALLNHVTVGADATTFQPMNVNFGLFPPMEGAFRGKERKQAMSARALRDFDRWLSPAPLAAE